MHCMQWTFEPERPMNRLQPLFSPPVSPMPSVCDLYAEYRAMIYASEFQKKSRYLHNESSMQETVKKP